MNTRIDHKLKAELGVTLLEYCVLDCFRLKPKRSLHATSKALNEEYSDVEKAVSSLLQKGLLVHDQESKEIRQQALVSGKSKAIVPVTEDGEKLYSIDYKFKLHVIEMRPEYVWTAKDAMHAKKLIGIFVARHQKKHINPPTDDEILIAFTDFINTLSKIKTTKRWQNWTIPMLNSQFNEIIGMMIIEKNSKTKFHESVETIVEASNNLLGTGRIKTGKRA